jgi:hypothetical protein
MIGPMIRNAIRDIAAEKFGDAPVFMARSTKDYPELRVAKGDLVVYAKTIPNPGDAVAVDHSGSVGFELWDPVKGARVKGVVITAIREVV